MINPRITESFDPITKDIYIVRGNDWEHVVTMEDESGVIPFVDGDYVKLTVRKSYGSSTKEIEKIITSFVDGMAVIHINPEDTAGKPFRDYVYDIETKTSVFGIFTPITGRFTIGFEGSY